ncbi:MAG: sugar phosphate isomerase/epimerase [Spirochaetales bacterium]|nr:sugar phosphate isomerase/epimerase [Spirochaetales bacterium]
MRERAFSYFERGVETAAYLGSPYTWIDSYFPPLEVHKGVVPTDELVYGQEFRAGEVVANSDAMLRMLEQVNDDNLGVILDIGHQYAQKEPIPLSVEKLGKHMKYVHVAADDGNGRTSPGIWFSSEKFLSFL